MNKMEGEPDVSPAIPDHPNLTAEIIAEWQGYAR